MPVNHTLADASDLAFKTSFVVYAVALVLFIAYYIRQKAVLEARAELAEAGARPDALVRVGGAAEPPARPAGPADGRGTGPDAAGVDRRAAAADRLGGIAEMALYLGVAVHLASVSLRGLSAHRFPWGNLYEYISIFTLIAMVVAAGVLRRPGLRVFWPFLITPVLGLMFYGGTKLYAASQPVQPALQSFWFPIHVSTVVLGASIFLISGVSSVLYLVRMRQPRGRETGRLGALARPLPSARTLDTIAYRTAIWAFPVFGLGVIFGAIWAEAAWGRFWGWDPKETVSFVTWILYAGYLHARATSGWRNHMAAWVNVVAFATMVFNLFFVNMVVSGLHSYAGLN
ncbi:c-type cytochrome biogenesis protein CcsB [Corynebacterium sphenisci]|uniref:c-type cytochrome biogenesis protein CcsB n=1 Tax=Corynebacterium sphenisci TaxID=191493 RepID=UPI0026DF9FBB|nr:c-type cytochrome biogenesis protein CcsB [Corynebacterium sphenisci]MDO5730839.1 c-type cytochrome biogenesis protein CcsB [Corynebacterium sphenisci]